MLGFFCMRLVFLYATQSQKTSHSANFLPHSKEFKLKFILTNKTNKKDTSDVATMFANKDIKVDPL